MAWRSAASLHPAESYITIDYTGFLPNGQVFVVRRRRAASPCGFRLGERQVVPGIVLCGYCAAEPSRRPTPSPREPARWRGNAGSSLPRSGRSLMHPTHGEESRSWLKPGEE